jgi:hypothetical protein
MMEPQRLGTMQQVTVHGAGPVPGPATLWAVAMQAGGYTMSTGHGGWRDGMTVAMEPCWTVTLLTGSTAAASAAVRRLTDWAEGHGQAEVLVTWAEVEGWSWRREVSA